MHVQLTEWIRSKIARDFWLEYCGNGLLLAVAVFAIPLLISGIGLPKFGVLTLAWVVVGYFSVFDLGLGRAMTQPIFLKRSNRTGSRNTIGRLDGHGSTTALELSADFF